MSFRFIHAADIHLGCRQYGHDERYNDFARAFAWLVDEALRERVDFVLLAGDLFEQRMIEPQTLFGATTCLARLREANIPVIATTGNHDLPPYIPTTDPDKDQDRFGWLDYLAEAGLLQFLKPSQKDGKMALDAAVGGSGAYLDLACGARVIGVPYYGGSTRRVVESLHKLLAELKPSAPAYTILLMHAGLQGVLDDRAATVTRAQLEPLRPYVQYLALGHIHKPYIQDEWIYNPGSLETHSVDEAQWRERGYFLVEVDPARTPPHQVQQIPSRRRAFERLRFDVEPYETPEALYVALERYVRTEATPQKVAQKPVVELTLEGRLAFDPGDLEMGRANALLEAAFHPLVGRISNRTTTSAFEVRADAEQTREELELGVLRELLERDVRRREDSAVWARMTLRLKQMALEDARPEEVIAALRAFQDELPQDEAQ